MRMCVDYQKLNNITIKNRYLLLNIIELQDQLAYIKIFIVLDLQDRYYLVRIKVGDEQKIVFRIRYRHYKYTIILFRLTNTLATFQILINNILYKYLDIFVIAYLDNILIYLENPKDYIKYIQTILEYFKKAKLRLRLEKCEFYKEEVNFLRFIVNTKGVKINKDKIEVVQNQLQLANIK